MLDVLPDLGAQDNLSLARAVRDGFPPSVVDHAVERGLLTAAEVDRLALPRKTLAHRRRLGRLTPEQSDRVLRLLRVIARAGETFGDGERARRWLRRPTTALGGSAPLDLLDTDVGAREVEDLLTRIDHGITA